MINEDRLHREKQEKLNELETAVYVHRDGLAGPLSLFASENEKQKLIKVLEEVENWVYEHQQDPQLTKAAIAAQLQQLAAAAQPLQHRQQQQQRRLAAADKLRATIQECRHTATAAAPEFAHIEQQVLQQLLQAAEADEAWLNRVMQEAAAQPPTENPTVLAETIEQRNSDLFALLNKICSTPKPKPCCCCCCCCCCCAAAVLLLLLLLCCCCCCCCAAAAAAVLLVLLLLCCCCCCAAAAAAAVLLLRCCGLLLAAVSCCWLLLVAAWCC
ncbi:LOW QUALITY PROTEIN: heat shock protein, putative [Eimeria necatrix]|uniref:Heat shock protein, putative n=1 Tax=Eimeria necatrix TaxID=51315 RepID=U6N0A2_9EIME|nr:LOW QUALITY PROTEIN: heat shock protein, putative [Eimeria necatrix]CDJ69913.1 heat shock protein, putative [Eimeria necatrix]